MVLLGVWAISSLARLGRAPGLRPADRIPSPQPPSGAAPVWYPALPGEEPFWDGKKWSGDPRPLARQLPRGEAQAATWILTHITPLAQVLTVRRHETTPSGIGTFPAIDMRIDPRVHPDAVLAANRMARRNIMGPRVRPLGKKAAELVDFVHTHGGPAEWRGLYKRWATTNPESWQDHDGRWAAQIDLGWEAGKRRCKTVYGRTRAEVADKLQTIQQQGRGGIVIALPSPLSSTRGLTPSSRPRRLSQPTASSVSVPWLSLWLSSRQRAALSSITSKRKRRNRRPCGLRFLCTSVTD